MSIESDCIAFFAAEVLQAIDDLVVRKEFLEENKSFFRLQIGISQHSLDPRSLDDVLARLAVIGDGERLGVVHLQHLFRIIFLFEYSRLGRKLCQKTADMIQKRLDALSGCGADRKYFDAEFRAVVPDAV